MRVRRSWLVGCVVYVVLVAALTASWVAPHDAVGGFRPAEALTFLLTLPVSLVTLPLSYVVLASVWNVTGADGNDPTWPVTLSYVAWFAALAVANAALITVVVGRIRRTDRSPTTHPAAQSSPGPKLG